VGLRAQAWVSSFQAERWGPPPESASPLRAPISHPDPPGCSRLQVVDVFGTARRTFGSLDSSQGRSASKVKLSSLWPKIQTLVGT
jgi:hypothetical protein